MLKINSKNSIRTDGRRGCTVPECDCALDGEIKYNFKKIFLLGFFLYPIGVWYFFHGYKPTDIYVAITFLIYLFSSGMRI